MAGQLDTFVNGIGWIDSRTTPEETARRRSEVAAREAKKAAQLYQFVPAWVPVELRDDWRDSDALYGSIWASIAVRRLMEDAA